MHNKYKDTKNNSIKNPEAWGFGIFLWKDEWASSNNFKDWGEKLG